MERYFFESFGTSIKKTLSTKVQKNKIKLQ